MASGKSKQEAGAPEKESKGKDARAAINPENYTAPVVLNIVELELLRSLLAEVPVSGKPDQLESMLATIRSIRGKLMLAVQVAGRKLP
jgi:hypothetical protein